MEHEPGFPGQARGDRWWQQRIVDVVLRERPLRNVLRREVRDDE